MEKKIKLSSILKGAPQKGITLYSPWFGDMKVKSVDPDNIRCYIPDDEQHRSVLFDDEGRVKQVFSGYSDIIRKSAECMIYPSSEKRDWDGFSIDVYPDLPNTWEEFGKTLSEEVKKNGGIIPHSEEMKTLQKALILRDCYRKSSRKTTMKFNVREEYSDPSKFRAYPVTDGRESVISFQDEMLAEKFIKNFPDLLDGIRQFL